MNPTPAPPAGPCCSVDEEGREVRRLRAALAFYADPGLASHYDEAGWYRRHTPAEADNGDTARRALAAARVREGEG